MRTFAIVLVLLGYSNFNSAAQLLNRTIANYAARTTRPA